MRDPRLRPGRVSRRYASPPLPRRRAKPPSRICRHKPTLAARSFVSSVRLADISTFCSVTCVREPSACFVCFGGGGLCGPKWLCLHKKKKKKKKKKERSWRISTVVLRVGSCCSSLPLPPKNCFRHRQIVQVGFCAIIPLFRYKGLPHSLLTRSTPRLQVAAATVKLGNNCAGTDRAAPSSLPRNANMSHPWLADRIGPCAKSPKKGCKIENTRVTHLI